MRKGFFVLSKAVKEAWWILRRLSLPKPKRVSPTQEKLFLFEMSIKIKTTGLAGGMHEAFKATLLLHLKMH
jgi:hypothetical protein